MSNKHNLRQIGRHHRDTIALSGTLLSLSQLAGTGLQAQESQEVPTEKLDELVVDAEEKTLYKPERLTSPKFNQTLAETTQTVTVIPEEIIREQNADTLRDVLRNVPGVTFSAGEGGVNPGDNINIRGFGSQNDIFVDGVRDGGLYSRDPFNIEQVEVAKGPASVNSGRGSFGGSVNLGSKKARLDCFNYLSLTGGTDDYFRGTLDMNREISVLDGAAFRLNLMYHNADIAGRDGVYQERFGFAPTVSFGLGSQTRVHLSYLYFWEDSMADYGIPRQAIGREGLYENFYGLFSRDFERNISQSFTAEIEHDFNESLSLNNTTRFSTQHLKAAFTAPRLEDDFTARRSDFKGKDYSLNTFSNYTNLSYQFETGSLSHNLSAGTELTIERGKRINFSDNNAGSAPTTPLANPNPNQPYTPDFEYGGFSSGETTSVGVYVFDAIEINPQWEVNAGLRYDYYEAEYGTGYTNDYNSFSYKAALVYKPAENGRVYLGYSSSFDPTANSPYSNVSDDPTNSGNQQAELDPEEAWTAELGTKWELFDKRALLSAAVFHTEKDSEAYYDELNSSYSLIGSREATGFELGLTGQVTDKWRVQANYAYINTEITNSSSQGRGGTVSVNDGNSFANAPEHAFSLWNVVDITDQLSAGFGLTYVGERESNDGNTADRVIDSYITCDALVGYRLNDTVSFQLNVNNIFDEKYIDRIGGGHSIPGEGRQAMLSTRFEF